MSRGASEAPIMSARPWVRRVTLAVGVLGTAGLVLVQACTSESVTGVEIGSVTVSPSSSIVLEGLTVQYDAVVYDETGVALPRAFVIWSSDSEVVASVDGQGLATGVATGETTIRASFNDTEATAKLTVQPGPDISVTPASATLYGGASGPAPGPATLGLTNEGGGAVGTLTVTVAYRQEEPAGWLRADLGAATVPTNLTLTADPTALAVGRYEATVTITSSNAEPVTVPVTLSLTAFTVTQSASGTRVAESGTTDSLRVVLDAAPASNVRLAVTSADTSEVRVSPAALTFTPSSWAVPQTVTITPVDDSGVDGDQTTVVTVSADDVGSDVAYRPALDRTVSVTTVDDDAAGLVIAETAGRTTVTEARGSDAFTVVLTAQPSADVFVLATSADVGEVTVGPSMLTFTSDDWDEPRTVTVTGVDDDLADGNQETEVTISVDAGASDDAFDGVAPRTVMVTTADDDAAGFTLADTAGLVVTEAGATDAFTVVLDVRPVSDVVLTVASGDMGEATASPATLMFTSSSWNVPRAVTLTGVDDDVVDGSQSTVVTVAVDDARSQDAFDGLQATARVTTTDDDAAGFTLQNATDVSVSEAGDTDEFTVALDVAPVSNVVLTVVSGDPGEVTATPQSLTFTPVSWSTAQTVTLTGVDDTVIDGDQQTTVTVAVDPVASDSAFHGLSKTLAAITLDNDENDHDDDDDDDDDRRRRRRG